MSVPDPLESPDGWPWRSDPWVRLCVAALVALAGVAVVETLVDLVAAVGPALLAAAGFGVLGALVVIVVWTPTSTQSRLGSQIAAERRKLEYYDAVMGDGSGEDGSPPSDVALEYRYRMASEALAEATDAVYRRDYPEALRLVYEASRHNVVISDVLDVDEVPGSRPGGEGTGGETPTPGSERTENLVARLRSFAGRMPDSRSELVRGYLDGEGSGVSPLDLYYALEVMHEWNVEQRKEVRKKKRYFRLAVVLFLLFGVGLWVLVASNLDILDSVMETQAGIDSGTLVLLVLLVGAAGALFSVLLSASRGLTDRGTDPSVPGSAFVYEALVLRVLVGSIGALLITVLVQTNVGSQILNTDVVLGADDSGLPDAGNLALLAFVSGFSEMLIKSSLDEFVDTTLETEEETDGDGNGRNGTAVDGQSGQSSPTAGGGSNGEGPGREEESGGGGIEGESGGGGIEDGSDGGGLADGTITEESDEESESGSEGPDGGGGDEGSGRPGEGESGGEDAG